MLEATSNVLLLSMYQSDARTYKKKDGSDGKAPAAVKMKISIPDDNGSTEEIVELPTEGKYAADPTLVSNAMKMQVHQQYAMTLGFKKFGNSPWRIEVLAIGKAA